MPVVVVDDASDDRGRRGPGLPAAPGPTDPPGRQRRTGRGPQRGPRRGRHRAGGLRGQRLPGDRGMARAAWSGCSTTPPSAPSPPGSGPTGPARTGVGPDLHRYSPTARSALDMGPDAERGGTGQAVRYVPAAALVVRRSALASGFDPDLRVGEDVDLVWRLRDEGWRVRYEPSVTVFHREPTSWRQTCWPVVSATAPRPVRCPDATPVGWPRSSSVRGPRSPSWPWLSGRRRGAVVAGDGVGRRPGPAGPPPRHPAAAHPPLERRGRGLDGGGDGPGRHHAGRAGPGGGRAPGGRPAAAALLVLAPPVVEWWRRRPDLDPVRWSLASIADDVAYGAGVWAGCVRSRSFGPLCPRVASRSDTPEDRSLG